MSLGRVTEIFDSEPSGKINLQVNEDNDIYRGDPPLPQSRRSSSPGPGRPVSISSSSFSGRLGTIAAVVELAISRWARGKGQSSNRSSASAQSSTRTQARPRVGRRQRRGLSSSNPKSIQSECDIRARLEARQESRLVPREFTFYLPPDSETVAGITQDRIAVPSNPVSRTASRSLVLGNLEAALRTSNHSRRDHGHLHTQEGPGISNPDTAAPDKSRKGKERDFRINAGRGAINASAKDRRTPIMPQKAWWLDVAGPTWADLEAIGKLLHLHPLTLEDILQQEPREKLEVFPKLGYYFVVFRAIESQTTREKMKKQMAQDIMHGFRGDPGIVDEALIYLIVFREGICSFHFTDVSGACDLSVHSFRERRRPRSTEYIDRVRDRVLRLEEGAVTSSDWIAYSLLDCVVDSFFPLLGEVGHEIAELEGTVYFGTPRRQTLLPSHNDDLPSKHSSPLSFARGNLEAPMEKERNGLEEKSPRGMELSASDAHLPSSGWLLRALRELRRSAQTSLFPTKAEMPAMSTVSTLHRISRTRRLVTSLARLLATKSEVITRMQKRPRAGRRHGDGDDSVAIYLGDVQDHILSLHMSLNHYERMLNHLYPGYLAQLNGTLTKSKIGIDKIVFLLTVVSIACVCVQALLAVFSLNVTLPGNTRDPSGSYTWFGIVIVLASVDLCVYLLVVSWWWRQAAKKKQRAY